MFFDDISEISAIAAKIGCGVFVVPEPEKVEIKNAILLAPEGRMTITIEQVREALARLAVRQTSDIFVLVRPADALGEEAENALLKSLEEPGEKVHFALVTAQPSKLLPTVLSRSSVYFLRSREEVDGDILADARVKETAKRLITARAGDLAELAEELSKKKDRAYVLSVLSVAIEMLYKSYFKTGKSAFVTKLPKFLETYENIAANGHIKLHLVADLV